METQPADCLPSALEQVEPESIVALHESFGRSVGRSLGRSILLNDPFEVVVRVSRVKSAQ